MKGSLFLRLFVPVAVIMALCLFILLWIVSNQINSNTLSESISRAESTVEQFKLIRAYYTKNIVATVLKSSDIKGSINHKDNSKAIPLPATMIHDLSTELSETGIRMKLFSAYPFPNRKERVLDSFEQDAWNALNKDPQSTFSREEIIDGLHYIRVAKSDIMVSPVCLACHNTRSDTPKNDWKLGDVRGVLSIDMPIDAMKKNATTVHSLLAYLLLY